MKRFLLLVCIVPLLLVSGCSGKSAPSSPVSAAGDVSATPAKQYPPRRKAADHEVIVMLGPDYASRAGILQSIIDEYGVSGAGGMTVPMLYPADFKIDGHTRLSALFTRAATSRVTTVVTVGAPGGTVNELNRIRAASPSMKVVTLFSLDDTLPVEGVSDLVLDWPAPDDLPKDGNTAASALSGTPDDTALSLLVLASILSVEDSPASTPLDSLAASLETARGFMKLKKSGPRWTLASWTDADTGLKSRNHLTLGFEKGMPE